MNISGGGACLTIQPSGALCAVAEEKLDLETRGVEVYQLLTIQIRISRAQNNETRLGGVFPVQEHYKTQATLQRLVPHDGGIQVQMRRIVSCAEVLATAQVLEGDLSVILPPCPTVLWGRTGIKKHAVGVAPQCGDGVQIEADDCLPILLLRIVAVHPVIGNARRQALPMRTQWLCGEVDPGFFPLGRRGVLSRRRLRDGQRGDFCTTPRTGALAGSGEVKRSWDLV